MKKTAVGLVLTAFLLFMDTGKCHGVDPYTNIALQEGFYLSVYPSYYEASKLKDRDGNTANNKLGSRSYQGLLRLTYYNKTILKKTIVLSVALPAGRKELLGDHDSGTGDLSAGAGYFFLDAPASKTWAGAGLTVDFPTGDFDKNKKANMGSNAWKIAPGIIFAKITGKLDVEGTLKYNIYTRNKATDVKSGNETVIELYSGYFLQPEMLLGCLFNGFFGEERTFKGKKISNSGIRKFQAGPSIYYRFSKSLNITIDALSEFSVRNTSKGQLFIGRFTYVFQRT